MNNYFIDWHASERLTVIEATENLGDHENLYGVIGMCDLFWTIDELRI